MKYRVPIWIVSLLAMTASLTGCEGQAVCPVAEEDEEVTVYLSLGVDPEEGAGTRASAPHTPEVENLIHDIWVLQFNERGILLNTETKYFPREGEAGLFVENFEVQLIAAQNSTVCLVVNTGDPDIEWPNNFPDFQTTLLDIQASNDLSTRERMPMCGYWIGNVTGEMALSAMLCRMMTRVNLVISNGTGAPLTDVIVELSSIPTKAYVYPRTNQDALPDDAYVTGGPWSDIVEEIPAGGSVQLYYYFAPNICSDETNATKASITSGERTWSVTLGSDSPDEADRDFTLYANNYYTFTLNLK